MTRFDRSVAGRCCAPASSRTAPTQEVRSEDCVLCHQADFDATSMPVHAASNVGFPTTCANCHRATDWRPALEGLHPAPNTYTDLDPMGQVRNQTFLIDRGPHAAIKCLACHDLGVALPAVPAAAAAASTPTASSATRTTRPTGTRTRGAVSVTGGHVHDVPGRRPQLLPRRATRTGDAVNHPKNKFPLTGGHDRPCTSCHDRSMGPDDGGLNTTCLAAGCHSLSRMDAEHEQRSYDTNRNSPPAPLTKSNFCRVAGCHPDGRKHDN